MANLADLTVQQELIGLYEEDADWNMLLADANDNRVYKEKEYKDFLDGFRDGVEAQIPVSSIYPKFSTVVYKSFINGWKPEEFYKGIRGYDKLDYKSYDLNEHEKLLVAVLAKEQNIEGIKVKDVRDNEGKSVFSSMSTSKSPTELIFAVPDDVFSLLYRASQIPGIQIFPVPRNKEYTETSEQRNNLVAKENLIQLINSKSDLTYND